VTFYSANVSGTTITLNHPSSYLVMYDPDGNVIWARDETGIPNMDGLAIAGEFLLQGRTISGTITIGSSTLVSAGGNDVFTAKYDLNGNAIWAQSGRGIGPGDHGSGVATDGSGNVYITGVFNGQPLHSVILH